jgi:hypothetical protein
MSGKLPIPASCTTRVSHVGHKEANNEYTNFFALSVLE